MSARINTADQYIQLLNTNQCGCLKVSCLSRLQLRVSKIWACFTSPVWQIPQNFTNLLLSVVQLTHPEAPIEPDAILISRKSLQTLDPKTKNLEKIRTNFSTILDIVDEHIFKDVRILYNAKELDSYHSADAHTNLNGQIIFNSKLSTLSKKETEFLISHELIHHKNKDPLYLCAFQLVTSSISLILFPENWHLFFASQLAFFVTERIGTILNLNHYLFEVIKGIFSITLLYNRCYSFYFSQLTFWMTERVYKKSLEKNADQEGMKLLKTNKGAVKLCLKNMTNDVSYFFSTKGHYLPSIFNKLPKIEKEKVEKYISRNILTLLPLDHPSAIERLQIANNFTMK